MPRVHGGDARADAGATVTVTATVTVEAVHAWKERPREPVDPLPGVLTG
jgi:hypothetical protein